MYVYDIQDYKDDLDRIENILKKNSKDVHIIAPYKGGLPMGTALANRLDAPLSILKMQRYDGADKEASFIYNANISVSEHLVLVDDLWDTGETIIQCVKFLQEQFPNTSIQVITIFGRDEHKLKHDYLREHPNEWIKFEAWE